MIDFRATWRNPCNRITQREARLSLMKKQDAMNRDWIATAKTLSQALPYFAAL